MSGALFMGAAWMITSLFSSSASSNIDFESTVAPLTPPEIAEQVSGQVKPLDYHDFSGLESIEQNALQVDPLREFKDLSTDIVVKLFLSSDKSMFNFLKLVYNTYNDSLDRYKQVRQLDKWDIFFVYKGGNVLRIITNDFLKELPKLASKRLNQYYEKFFKRSDADFSIYIKPTLPNYDIIYRELTILAYLLQVKIRQEFTSDLTKYFDFFKYTTAYQKQLITEYHEQSSKAKSLNDPNNAKFYKKRFDGIVFGSPAGEVGTINQTFVGLSDKGIQSSTENHENVMYVINTVPNMMYIQVNETLDFPAAGSRTKFNLIRTKLCMNYYFDGQLKQIGGELIDVSIPHKLDDNVQHFFEHTNYISQYQLELSSTAIPSVLTFRSYTLTYLISDLEYILFKFVKLPWNTPKYEKRLNRLFYLYFIDLFVKVKALKSRKTVIELLKNLFSIKIANEQSVEVFSQAASEVKNKITGGLEIVGLVSALMSICDELLRMDVLDTELASFSTMIDVLRVNCDFTLTAFEGITDYCSNEGNINMRVLYQNEFSSLI